MTEAVWITGLVQDDPLPSYLSGQGRPLITDLQGRLRVTAAGAGPSLVQLIPHGSADSGTWNYVTGDFGVVQNLNQLRDLETLIPNFNVTEAGDRNGNAFVRRGIADASVAPNIRAAASNRTELAGLIHAGSSFVYQIMASNQFAQPLYFCLLDQVGVPVDTDTITLPILVVAGASVTVDVSPEQLFSAGVAFTWSLTPDVVMLPVFNFGATFLGSNYVQFSF